MLIHAVLLAMARDEESPLPLRKQIVDRHAFPRDELRLKRSPVAVDPERRCLS